MRALFLALTLSLAPSFVSDAIAQDDVPTSPTMLEKLRAMEPKLLAHLAEHAPDKHAQLMRLQRLDRRAYYKALARVAHAAQEAARRLGAQWVHVHDPQGPAPALCETVVPWHVGLQHPEVVALYTAWVADAAKPVEPAFVQLKLALLDLHLRVWAELAEGALGVVLGESLLEQAGQGKLLVVASGRGAWALLRALSFSAALRDRVVASVSVGGVVQGRPGDPGKLGRRAQEDWLGAWFQHELLDVEVVHPVPYLAAELVGPHVNPLGLEGLPVASQRYPEPTYVGGEPTMVEVMDLGLIYASEQTPWEAVGEALRATTGLVALARRV